MSFDRERPWNDPLGDSPRARLRVRQRRSVVNLQRRSTKSPSASEVLAEGARLQIWRRFVRTMQAPPRRSDTEGMPSTSRTDSNLPIPTAAILLVTLALVMLAVGLLVLF